MFDRLDSTDKRLLTVGFLSAGLIAQALIIGFVVASTDCFCKTSCIDYRLEKCSGIGNFTDGHTTNLQYRSITATDKNLSEVSNIYGRVK